MKSDLFTVSPTEDLVDLVSRAKTRSASSLLLLSNQPPVWRVDGQLDAPASEDRLHFSQLEKLIEELLTQSERDCMELNGAVEVERVLGEVPVRLHVFYATGSHNVVVYLDQDGRTDR